ncbi:MAG TPA: hypothetical protein VD999_06605 [Vitreimonas sp.]|nr:hypothetical protein [Vitreimonas sp.]
MKWREIINKEEPDKAPQDFSDLVKLRFAKNEPVLITGANFPNLVTQKPELKSSRDNRHFAYMFETETIRWKSILSLPLEKVSYSELVTHQNVLYYPSQETVTLAGEDLQHIQTASSQERLIAKQLFPLTKHPDLNFPSPTQTTQDGVNIALSLKCVLDLMTNRYASAEELISHLLELNCDISLLIDSLSFIVAEKKIPEWQSSSSHLELQNSLSEFYEVAAELLLMCAQVSLTLHNKPGKLPATFPYVQRYYESTYPSLEFIPYILFNHLLFLIELPGLIKENNEFEWINIINSTKKLMGESDASEDNLVFDVVLLKLQQEHHVYTNREVMTLFQHANDKLKKQISDLVEYTQLVRSLCMRVISFYSRNMYLLNKTKQTEMQVQQALSHPEYALMRQEILDSGGRAPLKGLRIKYRHRTKGNKI